MKTFAIPWLFSWLLLFCNSEISYAQPDQLQFEHLYEQQGLSQNSVWSILQDREGFMWFGTLDGLNKYDGYTFTVLKPDPDDPEHTLHHNIITDIHEDRKGRLWVTTFGGGFHQVDKYTGKVTRYGIKPTNMILWNVLVSIYEDQQGILWIGGMGGAASFDPETKQFTLYATPTDTESFWIAAVTEDSADRLWMSGKGGVYQLNRSTGKFIPFVLDSTLVHQPGCWSLYLDKEGILWAGTEGEGLFRMDTHGSPLHFTRYNPGGVASKNIIFNSIYEDNHGYLWLSGSEGLQRIDKHKDVVLNFQANPSQPGSLSYHKASTIYQDRTGTLWIGTDNGINKVTAHGKHFHSYQLMPALPSIILHQNNIGTLLEDHTGKIWLGSAGSSLFGSFENGLFQFDLKSKKIKHFQASASNPDSLASNQVWAVYEDQKKQLWVGTQEALHLLDSTTGKFIRYPAEIPVACIAEDSDGKLWIGGSSFPSGGIASFDPGKGAFRYYKYDPRDTAGLKDAHVWGIMASRSGDIWVALSGAGIARLNQQTDQFTSYLPSSTDSPGHLNDKDVRALYEDSKGVVWAGTNQGGLHRFDSLTNTFTYFTMRDGLPSNHILSIIGDEQGNLWLGTNKGISRFNPETKTFRNFDVSDGLPANEFILGSVYSRHGKLMFGSVNGFVIFDPDSIQDNPVAPPVYITSFKVLEKSRPVPTDKVELPYDENFLSFDFVALNYDAPEKNQYAYRLEGVDKDWVYSGTRRFASYTNLDPGEYTFRVKGSNNDGIWNEQGASLQLTILPPWWRTWWAYSLYALLALGTILSIRHYEIKQLKLRERAAHLAELDQMKTRFFANISHEFRTPLTLILGPLKAMQEGSFTGDAKAAFAMMIRNGQRLLRLINQLLDISKLEAGKMQLQAKQTELVLLLRHIASAYESLAREKKIKYFFYAEVEQLQVYVDEEKITTIVHNLLSNAFKFTTAGGEVILHLKKEEDQWIAISVKDTGTGIPAEELDKVFDRFYQVDSSQTRAHEGSGLGMALAQELAELHHGQITVESRKGKGTTFTLRLPLDKTHLPQEEMPDTLAVETHYMDAIDQGITTGSSIVETEDHATEEPFNNHPLILVVEDNADMRHYISSTLQGHYQIIEAENGREGVRKAKALLPDLILSDVMMPVMDGYQLCEKIKTDELTSHIPVILLTARADRQSKLTGLETGADDYLAKPFDAEELLLIIRNHIEERRKLREHFSRQITLEPKHIAVTSLDEQFLQKVMQVIETHMADAAFGVEEFGREIGMSRMQLFRKLKALTDHSPSDFIRIMRLKRAAELLSQGAGNIAEVAFLMGFQDPSYFTKCFQKQYGQTPSEYVTAHSL